jgi:crotonobetaine/carnitine-CoA ligase
MPAPATDALDTVLAVLDHAAARDGEDARLRCAGRNVSAAALRDDSLRLAAALAGWGVVPGDRVAVMLGNGPEFLATWFGILRAGAVEVPVHSAYRGVLLEHILRESGARVLVCEGSMVERLAGLDLPALERVVVHAGGDDVPANGRATSALADALAGPAVPATYVPAADDVSCILYTSGTTGPAKGAVLTHRANLQLARANVQLMEYTADDVLYTAFPLFHVNAKFTSVVSSLLSGARVVVDERLGASRFWDTMREHGVTSFNYMGSMLTILSKQPERPGDRGHGVVRAYGGGCPGGLWEAFEARFGVRLHEHYGMTEIGIATWNTRTDRRPGSCGRAVPYYDVRLAGPDDAEVPVGEVGELQIRPRHPGTILREYWQRPEATIEATRNLWFHTGDRARLDADGYFTYVDRVKDSIRRRGENVSSWEVESVVNAFPGVVESAAYGVPSDLGEDEVMVALVLEDGGTLELPAFVAHCEARLAYFTVPRYVRVCAELPKTPSQRVQKFRLREDGVTPDTHDRGEHAAARPRG